MISKIFVIGNACSGKTTLSRKIADVTQLPLIHVDSIQFLSGMVLRNQNETREILKKLASQEKWIFDGFGPLNLIEDRFAISDKIIFIRLPLWLNYLLCLKRQMTVLFYPRKELPADCFESTLSQTLKLFKSIHNVHYGMWPQLERIFKKAEFKDKLIRLDGYFSYRKFLKHPSLDFE